MYREEAKHHPPFPGHVVHEVVVAAAYPGEVRQSSELVDDVSEKADRVDHHTLEDIELFAAAEYGEKCEDQERGIADEGVVIGVPNANDFVWNVAVVVVSEASGGDRDVEGGIVEVGGDRMINVR